MKRGVFFSIDALVALGIIVIGLLVVFPFQSAFKSESFVQRDLLYSLSTLKISEFDSSLVRAYNSSGLIRDGNKSVLEQIGEFYVTNKTLAKDLSNEIFDMVNTTENLGIWFGSELVASRNSTPINNSNIVISDRQLISGIQEGESVTAFSSRAILSSKSKKNYFYFGGYVGEGNISTRIFYSGNLSSVEMEIATDKNFDVYVNGIYSGSYNGSSSIFIPKMYSIPTDNFNSGENIIELAADDFNIAGGFIKISYAEDYVPLNYSRYYFPGISGIVNLYDGFSSPGKITSMNIFLHLNNSLRTFLNIGNVTVYNGSTNGEENISINDSYLQGVLDYSSFENKTVPIRLGIENASYESNVTIPADTFSVTDLSGSMNLGNCYDYQVYRWYCDYPQYQFWCTASPFFGGCGGKWGGNSSIEAAKDANKAFIDSVLNSSKNRVGLVGYQSSFNSNFFHALSNDSTSLKNEVDSWYASGGTCICCGINEAADRLVADSNSSFFRSIVVMSDGAANYGCSRQGTGNAKQDAIQAACDAYNNSGIRVFSVGFGSYADEATLQSIANCGNGTYYYGNVSNLVEIYKNIAGEIIKGTFSEQRLAISGNFSSRLWPDSYIEFNYVEETPPFGIIASIEENFQDSNYGTFDVPSNSSVIGAWLISYSGPKWTAEAYINGFKFYNLADYGSDFTSLGDPYSLKIPLEYINSSNIVNITTGVDPSNLSNGSSSNKIIYIVRKQDNVAYSGLSSSANGCSWYIEFENNNFTTINVPSNYSGNENCFYTSLGQNISNSNDAVQLSVLKLLETLDFDSDGIVDVDFGENDIDITSSAISGIPYSWSTEMQIRTWK